MHLMHPFCITSLLKTLWEKKKFLVTSNFSFSNSVFYMFEEPLFIFIKHEIVICKLFQFGRVWNFFVWDRVNESACTTCMYSCGCHLPIFLTVLFVYDKNTIAYDSVGCKSITSHCVRGRE